MNREMLTFLGALALGLGFLDTLARRSLSPEP